MSVNVANRGRGNRFVLITFGPAGLRVPPKLHADSHSQLFSSTKSNSSTQTLQQKLPPCLLAARRTKLQIQHRTMRLQG